MNDTVVMAPSDGGASPADAKRHLTNWQDEVDSAALYRALADLEGNPALADAYRRLAGAVRLTLIAALATYTCMFVPRARKR